MKRRRFIALLGGAAVGWPFAIRAQVADRKGIPVVGFLHHGSERAIRPAIDAFQSGLAALGYGEGQNIRVIYRFAEGNAERLPALTAELVSLDAKIIVTSGTTAIRAAHNSAPEVPIVSWASGDPVIMGWAQSLARPGGMITGLFLIASTVQKPVELLKEVRPQATKFSYLFNVANPGNAKFRSAVNDVAKVLGIKVEIIELKEKTGLAEAFSRMVSLGVEGVAIIPDPMLGSEAAAISELARLHKLPSVGDTRDFAAAGGLFAFFGNYLAMARRSAWYVDRILKGTPPGELPAEQVTEFKLIVNLKTAKTLGLNLPPSILARADEVIE